MIKKINKPTMRARLKVEGIGGRGVWGVISCFSETGRDCLGRVTWLADKENKRDATT